MTTSLRELKSRALSNALLKPVLRKVSSARCEAWDFIHRVDTCGAIPLAGLDFHGKNKTDGLEYQSHHPSIIRAGLKALAIGHQDYTFIDIGCGKGRVLLIASEFPFRRIVGLEFAPQLAEVARRNLQRYRSGHQACSRIEVITGDALDYQFPPEPQVLYFYSPFSPGTLDQIAQNIEESLQRWPRELLVLFSGVLAMRDRAFGSRAQYERLQRGRYIDLYRHRP